MSKRRVLLSAPYMQPVVDQFRSFFEQHAIELVVPQVNERLSESQLLEDIDITIRKRLRDNVELDTLRRFSKVYDFDRYWDKADNNDIRWYLAPKGYNNKQTISKKNIEKMYNVVRRKLNRDYFFSGVKDSYKFFELDYETKKITCWYIQRLNQYIR